MNIREMRETTGLTQREFAESFDIPLGTIRRWEYGESTPAPYVLKMISEHLPMNKSSMQKFESDNETYFYDQTAGVVVDSKGTKIKIDNDLKDVKEQNLIIYLKELFEAYYEAVERFKRDCRLDKEEGIIWG